MTATANLPIRAVIGDFGDAMFLTAASPTDVRTPHRIYGVARAYAPPEIYRSQSIVVDWTVYDAYSLGCIMFDMLAPRELIEIDALQATYSTLVIDLAAALVAPNIDDRLTLTEAMRVFERLSLQSAATCMRCNHVHLNGETWTVKQVKPHTHNPLFLYHHHHYYHLNFCDPTIVYIVRLMRQNIQ